MTKVGDVVRFDEFRWARDSKNLAGPHNPLWGRVTAVQGNGGNFELLYGKLKLSEPDKPTDIAFYEPNDSWEIPPESEWPAEVCVAMAKRALLGDPIDDE
jgi:hypothetical protein